MVPISHHDNQQPGDLIDLSKARNLLSADYLSDRHSKQLLFDLLESGRLSAYGIQDCAVSEPDSETPLVEVIEPDFWRRINKSWDDPALGFTTGRFMSSGTKQPVELDVDIDRPSHTAANSKQSDVNDLDGTDDNLEVGLDNHPLSYRDVQISLSALIIILEHLSLDFDAIDLQATDNDDDKVQPPQVGRRMSEKWPAWIGEACRLAHEHKIHGKTTPNQVVGMVEENLGDQTIARSTARRAAEEIVEAIKKSSAQHRFGT